MHSTHSPSLADDICSVTGQDVTKCYQCGKCAAGCPVRSFMEDAPNTIVRFVQLGFEAEALKSTTPWLCAGCETCSSRCPQEFDLAGFMDAIRQVAIRKGVAPPDKGVHTFHQVFLSQIEKHGRSYELGLIRDYKLQSGHLFQDVDLAPGMFLKGKMKIMPHNISNLEALREMFRRARGME